MSAWKAFYEHKLCSSEEPKCSMTLGCFAGFKQKGIIHVNKGESFKQKRHEKHHAMTCERIERCNGYCVDWSDQLHLCFSYTYFQTPDI